MPRTEKKKLPRGKVVTTRTLDEIEETLRTEGELRGHTRSVAADLTLRLGLPHYLKKFPKKFDRANA